MSKKPEATKRQPRSDGARNRARLVAAAKVVFAKRGPAATLEEIARKAEVGIGTLYRHFPTRDALIEAVYRQEADKLVEAAAGLLTQPKPAAALRQWLLLFVQFIDTKRGMADVLNTLIGGPDALYQGTPVRLASSIEALVERAVKNGDCRTDVEPLDLLRAIGGVATLTPGKQWKQSAVRMVDLLIRGLRPGR